MSMSTTPPLSKPSTYKGSTKEERRVLMASFNLYISQTNALTANGVRPFVMPVSACIEPGTKQRVAEWDMDKDPEDVTESEWVAWFKQGYDVEPRALDSLKKRIKAAVVFDMSIQHADSRVGRMLDGLSAAVRRDRQEWVFHEESQAIVKIITDAIKPASLHRAVTEQMALTRNKALKKNVYRFVRWLREYAIGHERFVGYEEDVKPMVKIDQPKGNSGKAQAARQTSTHQATKAPDAAPAASGQVSRASAKGCLKCKSTSHHVRECPGISEEEAVRLLKEHGRALAKSRANGSREGAPGGRMATMKKSSAVPGRSALTATVEGVLSVKASLLDSGADMSVASGGLVSALLAAGASPQIATMGPFSLHPYGADSKPVVVTKQVRLGSLEFKTACGPLMLRGLRVWIDESVSNVELTLGLPVMQKLGYNEQTLLESAYNQQAVWDFSEQPVSTPGAAMFRALHWTGRDEAVHTILMAKVNEAAAQGAEKTAIEDLRSFLLEYRDVFQLEFGRDSPVKVDPQKVHLKPESVPVKSGLR
ncbi:hypothetical protein H310_11400 [Aphanomyces invadans]|uniref:Peptidase A2 domain-containing protein n=1 Tax=Aphanomyces invadans TaxID=157072 RepID=A0A024TNB9_9STRA|nr:hypothetical protein H310_11400 [Aphanomyces invadans]ETV95131.1 hypothetical protein H310_11400 [Aphanomyces invadans]|eukprot:XP_008876304.1 hypothetical protein H310_11400 [Aphanomyces invadans]